MSLKDKLMLSIPALGDVDVSNAKLIYSLIIAVLSTSFALGGFAVCQYVKDKSKRLEFLKKVTDVLFFFKSLDVCQSTLSAVVDLAEKEKSKQALLIYALMLNEKHPFKQEVVQTRVNA
jgi:hypothetical protein